MNDIIHEMQEYYQKRASVYDASMAYDCPETVRSLDSVIGRLRELLSGRRVLEIACGPCFWTEKVSSATRSMLCTDYNESTLVAARKKSLDWEQVSLQVADAYALPVFSDTFDACLAVDWFGHVPRGRIQEFLEGLHTTLSDSARVVFCDQLPKQGSLTGCFDPDENHIQERELPDGSTYRVIKHYFSDEDYHDIFSRYTSDLRIQRFQECKRLIVCYEVDI
jgi:ubiquinone/menaquinone biosynthesis C-methylase UbiE